MIRRRDNFKRLVPYYLEYMISWFAYEKSDVSVYYIFGVFIEQLTQVEFKEQLAQRIYQIKLTHFTSVFNLLYNYFSVSNKVLNRTWERLEVKIFIWLLLKYVFFCAKRQTAWRSFLVKQVKTKLFRSSIKLIQAIKLVLVNQTLSIR